MSFLNPPFETQIKFLIYRFRFLGLYLVFGVLSLVLEFFIRAYLINLGLDHILSTLFAIFCGILFAFWVNVKFNFKIPKSRKIRAMVYFVIISCISCIYGSYFLCIRSLTWYSQWTNFDLLRKSFLAD